MQKDFGAGLILLPAQERYEICEETLLKWSQYLRWPIVHRNSPQEKKEFAELKHDYPQTEFFLFPHGIHTYHWGVWMHAPQHLSPFTLGLSQSKTMNSSTALGGLEAAFTRARKKWEQKQEGNQPLGPLWIWEGMGGGGGDTLMLLQKGFSVRVWERNPVLACLWELFLLGGDYQGRLQFTFGDFLQGMQRGPVADIEKLGKLETPFGIYLDPMFAEEDFKRKGLPSKEIQILKRLVQISDPANLMQTDEEAELFQLIKERGPRLLVVKRPKKGPFYAGRPPHGSIEGKSIRFDLYGGCG